MSKVAGQSVQQQQAHQAAQQPWDDTAASEVRQLRSAITEHMADKKVKSDVAPMMSELLARLDSFVEGQTTGGLEPPNPPNLAEPPSLQRAAGAMSTAGAKVRQFARAAADPQARASLANMAKVLDAHLHMRQEVLARSEV
ncbi:MAG: hypothetical protein ACOC9W_01065 [Persicimonas sp.]